MTGSWKAGSLKPPTMSYFGCYSASIKQSVVVLIISPIQRRGTILAVSFVSLATASLYSPASWVQDVAKKPAPSYVKTAGPLIAKYCSPCHKGKNAAGGIDLARIKTDSDAAKASSIWDRVRSNVAAKTMPPGSAPQPSAKERAAIVQWAQAFLESSDCDLHDPGRVTLRRLNRTEYNNTIRDLVGIDFQPADDFPSDDVGYGFDNIGDVLSISPLLMEKYLTAAEQIAEKAIRIPVRRSFKLEGLSLQGDEKSGRPLEDGTKMLFTVGEVGGEVNLQKSGNYVFRAKAWGQQAGSEVCKMAFRIDDKPISVVEVAAEKGKAQLYEVPIKLSSGKHRIAVAFTNDFYDPKAPNPMFRDRNLAVDYIELWDPNDASTNVPSSHKRIIFEQPTPENQDAVARKILGAFSSKAFRRPATSGELDRICSIYSLAIRNREPFERGIQLGVEAVLVSPNFLFHVELDTSPGDERNIRALNDWELASRLSYFLWSTLPDSELTSLAAQGTLHKPDVLKAQVRRMLKDPKAVALSENFASQWLQLRKMAIVSPDLKQFSEFNESLRTAMVKETELFFDSVVREDRSVIDFIDGNYSYLNGPLAKLYGVPDVSGDAFQRVELKDPNRGGVLTQASILTITSNPTRTSPVKRGKFILENILGAPTPPPPPGAGNLIEEGQKLEGLSLRKRLEEHRKKPECASCHARLDPLGFGLENFGPIGKWRTEEAQIPIDSSGILPDGKKFSGAAELKSIIKSRKNEFVRCLAEKLMTYALGRGMTTNDQCVLDELVKSVSKQDYRFSAIILNIVESDSFLKRRGESGAGK